MSESKSPRSIPEIQNEYQVLCAKAGHLQYQIFTLQKDLGMVNDTLRDLNVEASERKALESAEAQAQEAKKEAEEKKEESK